MRKVPQASILDRLLMRLRGSPRVPPEGISPPPRPFQAISIYRGIEACQIARKFSDHRFLSRDAPQLPLSGCTMSDQCDCRYVKHRDRRGDPRRLVDFGVSPTMFNGNERRRTGRRARDG